MKILFEKTSLRNHPIKNRIVFPPMVNFHWSDSAGMVKENHIRHYEKIAAGGPGLMIVEATAVMKDGRGFNPQLGIWDNSHIEGMKKITDVCHAHNAVVLLQLHHAGLVTPADISPNAAGPSAEQGNNRSYPLNVEEIHCIRDAFIEAAVRAEKAGFDGVEIHGAHMYLLCQFASARVNQRTDEYGGSTAGRLKLAKEILEGIREKTNTNFIMGYRMGANAPDINEGIRIAAELKKYGTDILHVSHGGYQEIIPEVPAGFPYNWIAYSGTVIKKHVKVPVIVVNEIKTPQRAEFLLENKMTDFVAIGKDMLTDYEWAKKAMSGKEINYCIRCQPKCRRYENENLCPKKT